MNEKTRAAALDLPEASLKASGLSGVLNEWMVANPMAALDWLEAQPPSSTLQNARRNAINLLFNRDFDAGKAYLESLETSVDRRRVMEAVHFHDLVQGRPC